MNIGVEWGGSTKNGMCGVLGCALVNQEGKGIPLGSAATVYLENGVKDRGSTQPPLPRPRIPTQSLGIPGRYGTFAVSHVESIGMLYPEG